MMPGHLAEHKYRKQTRFPNGWGLNHPETATFLAFSNVWIGRSNILFYKFICFTEPAFGFSVPQPA